MTPSHHPIVIRGIYPGSAAVAPVFGPGSSAQGAATGAYSMLQAEAAVSSYGAHERQPAQTVPGRESLDSLRRRCDDIIPHVELLPVNSISGSSGLPEPEPAPCALRGASLSQLSMATDQVSPTAAIAEVRELLMREMRERMDGQRSIHEESRIQQESLLRVTAGLDEALIELRTELPRLRQEATGHRSDLEKVCQMRDADRAHADNIEKALEEEKETRRVAERALSGECRELVVCEAQRSDQAIGEFRELTEELRRRRDSDRAEFESLKERDQSHAEETAEQRRDIDRLSHHLQSLQDSLSRQAAAFDKKLSDQEASLRSWVDTAFVGRLGSLERALRDEMTERSLRVQQAQDGVAHNADLIGQLQAKLDRMVLEARLGTGGVSTSSLPLAAGHAGAGSATLYVPASHATSCPSTISPHSPLFSLPGERLMHSSMSHADDDRSSGATRFPNLSSHQSAMLSSSQMSSTAMTGLNSSNSMSAAKLLTVPSMLAHGNALSNTGGDAPVSSRVYSPGVPIGVVLTGGAASSRSASPGLARQSHFPVTMQVNSRRTFH